MTRAQKDLYLERIRCFFVRMISPRVKALYFTLAGPLVRANAAVYRAFRAPKTGGSSRVRVHLGPGHTNYLV